MIMNYEELIAALTAHYGEDEVDEFAYDLGSNKDITKEIGKMKEVQQNGGEDQGSNWFSIKYFPKHDIYIKVSGYYQSYSGITFDGWSDVSQVKPVEKTVTVYE